jgi:2-polyprenyl-3-methyl-5-hydroxy-6-metoxy-1,4-benzoquinol methylase
MGSLYSDLAGKYGQFPYVISLEVVEHLFHPKVMAKTLFNLTEPQGYAIVSTPYHGYLKNLAIALAGKFDFHAKPLWDYGHIKFFSIATMTELLQAAGFMEIEFRRLGRIPSLAKSMLAIAKKP